MSKLKVKLRKDDELPELTKEVYKKVSAAAGDLFAEEDSDSEKDDEAEAEPEKCVECDEYVIQPRNYKSFYSSLLEGLSIKKRPPLDHCPRCGRYELVKSKMQGLQAALLATDGGGRSKEQKGLIASHGGGDNKAWEKLRELEREFPNLLKHVTWKETQRNYLKEMEVNLDSETALLQLDYGTVTDSAGAKVGMWCVTVLQKVGNRIGHHTSTFYSTRKVGMGRGRKKTVRLECFVSMNYSALIGRLTNAAKIRFSPTSIPASTN